jgi:hypothetical protein
VVPPNFAKPSRTLPFQVLTYSNAITGVTVKPELFGNAAPRPSSLLFAHFLAPNGNSLCRFEQILFFSSLISVLTLSQSLHPATISFRYLRYIFILDARFSIVFTIYKCFRFSIRFSFPPVFDCLSILNLHKKRKAYCLPAADFPKGSKD